VRQLDARRKKHSVSKLAARRMRLLALPLLLQSLTSASANDCELTYNRTNARNESEALPWDNGLARWCYEIPTTKPHK